MAKDLITFESVCKSLIDEHPDKADDLKTLSDIALVLGVAATAGPLTAITVAGATPAVIALTAIGTLANFFAVKDKVHQTVEYLISKITNKKDDDPLQQMRRMERAYHLICYTAFFEALSRDKELAPLIKKVKLKPDEKVIILADALKKLPSTTQVMLDAPDRDPYREHERATLFRFQIDLPHPGDTLQVEREKLQPLYKQLAMGTEVFFTNLALWQDLHENERAPIKAALEKLPENALQRFEAQYYMLATKCEPFAKWLNYKESDKARTKLSKIEKKLEELANTRPQDSDIGLQKLSVTITNTYQKMVRWPVDKALQALNHKYQDILQSPVLDAKDTTTEEGQVSLVYPRIDQIFIPQAFKILHYTNQKQLEPDEVWQNIPERNDLGYFLHHYFLSPASERSPLIILGQPGSGKSLLTKVLAARMLVSSFTPIRIELRNINAEADIKAQITDQITYTTGRKLDWGMLSEYFEQQPGLILFDGYDELLQATGKVFSGYLRDVEQFQIDQITLGYSPVLAVVTSRINLIDKAEIPPDATIIRLLEFDDAKQNAWINIWNDENSLYFQQARVKRFALPPNNKEITDLARQPLLLLMLALYDSAGNPLGKTKGKGLNQTRLYDNLLRQFIDRELKKDSATFKNMSEEERKDAIERRMECFGIAAIGMFNRRALHIHARQLDADLKFFHFEDALPGGKRRNLTSAEKLFGSFFFVKLEATHKFAGRKTASDAQEYNPDSDVAYEFLHNTFGEFLTADFILRKILYSTYRIHKMSLDRHEQPALKQALNNPNSDHPGKYWYASLMCTPLFSRPVIITMMRQWLKDCLQQRKKARIDNRDEKTFLKNLDMIVESFLEFVLSKNQLPDIMIGKEPHSFDNLPTLGYLAIYTLNLILLRTMFDPDGYTFVEADEIVEEGTTQPTLKERFPSPDGTRAWDRLTFLWRSWFSLETLNGLATIFRAGREGEKIRLTTQLDLPSNSRLEQIRDVSEALADDVTAGLSGLLLHDSYQDSETEIDDIRKRLASAKIDMELTPELSIKRFQHLEREQADPWKEVFYIFKSKIRNFGYKRQSTYISLLEQIKRTIYNFNNITGSKTEKNINIEVMPSLIHIIEDYKLAITINDLYYLVRTESLAGICIEIMNEVDTRDDQRIDLINLLFEVLKFLRETGTWSDNTKSRITELQEQILLFHKGRIPANVVIEMLKLVYETGTHETLNYFSQHYHSYLEEMTNPEKSISTELAIELVKLTREQGDQNALDYFFHYLNRRLKERKEVNSEFAIEVINFASEVSNQKTLADFLNEYVDAIIKSRSIPIKLLIRLLKLTGDDGYQILSQYLIVYCRNMITEKRDLAQELVTVMIQFAHHTDDQDILNHFSGDYLKDMLQVQQLIPVELAVELVKLAQAGNTYDQASIESFYHKNINADRCYLDVLPIGTIVDLRRLAQGFGDDELVRKIERKMGL
jgi:hypothetical protein